MARKTKRMRAIDKVMVVLLLIGGLSIGLSAWLNFVLVEWLSFGMDWLGLVIKSVIGLSAVVGSYRLLRK